MHTPDFDITILGTGPVGCALALALAHHAPAPARIALVGPAPKGHAPDQPIDPRALAVNQGSRQFLEALGAWPARSADILTVHVSQVGQFGRTLIDHASLNVPRLGCVVPYDHLLETLYQTTQQAGITHVTEPARAPRAGTPVQLAWANRHASTRLAVLSYGTGAGSLQRAYRQHAVVAQVQASQPQPGRAFERFTRTGPLALLPHPAGAARYSLVWCVTPEQAPALCALPDDAFDAQLQARFGRRLGTLHKTGRAQTFPLSLHAAPSLRGTGLIAIGNAAQTLHPVAGQGLNLGLRDAAQLAYTLQSWLARPDDSPQALLERYARQRRLDRSLTLGFTDTLPRLFASGSATVRTLSGLGLLALDLFPALRKPLARHLLQGQRL